MTIKDLIKTLQKMPQDAIPVNPKGETINSISVNRYPHLTVVVLGHQEEF